VLAKVLPLSFDNLRIEEDYIHTAADGLRYICLHGDAFDAVTQNSKLIAVLGDIGYQGLLKVNRYYNRYRRWRGKEFFSLSKAIKARVKTAVNYISRFEESVVSVTRRRDCDGFICGHIHSPADKTIDGLRYLNSGDWVESNTAIVEHFDGRMEVIDFDTFMKWLGEGNELQANSFTNNDIDEKRYTLIDEDEEDESSPVAFVR
jgi:UDP-2,3-diacylglucosamine pyrophosphatase LpxH